MMKQNSKTVRNIFVDNVIPRPFLYKRVFAYGSLQFCGHIEEYLATYTVDLLIFIVQPRIGPHTNIVRRYHKGILMEERAMRSSQNVFLCYLFWYMNHIRELLRFSRRDTKTLVLGGHPLVFFGMGLFCRLRSLTYAYWIGDYFPSPRLVLRLFERVKKRYHDHLAYTFYLTDAINKIMNGAVITTLCRRTIMWGLKPFPVVPPPPMSPFSLLFVGLIRPGQGLEKVFEFLSSHRDYRLTIVGVCPQPYYIALQQLIHQQHLTEQIIFPNRFFSESELLEVARSCHVGLALYDTSLDNFTHYADPGKIKAYAEMNLPIIMTRISDIVPFVERFKSGVVIEDTNELTAALENIRDQYARYQAGVAEFNQHFEYVRYYRDSFKALETCWS